MTVAIREAESRELCCVFPVTFDVFNNILTGKDQTES